MTEALAYLIIMFEEEQEAAEREQVRYYLEHMSRVHAQPPQTETAAKENAKFIESIKPEIMKKAPERDLSWDFEALENGGV